MFNNAKILKLIETIHGIRFLSAQIFVMCCKETSKAKFISIKVVNIDSCNLPGYLGKVFFVYFVN